MMPFCSIFDVVLQEFLFYVAVLWFYKTKQFAVFGNFRGILMQFAVFYVFLCGV